MKLTIFENAFEVSRVALSGRLDVVGAIAIELQFTAAIVPLQKNALVDISEVSFLSSMGIRLFVTVAKILKRRHQKLILINPQSQVMEVLTISGLINVVFWIAPDEESGLAMITQESLSS